MPRIKVAKVNPQFCQCEKPKRDNSGKLLPRCGNCGKIIGGKK